MIKQGEEEEANMIKLGKELSDKDSPMLTRFVKSKINEA